MSVAENRTIRHASLSLSTVYPHPRNYRIHTEKQLAQLQKSLLQFGQVRSIVVQDRDDGTYLTVAGHGVAEAARGLNWNTIAADIIPSSWTEREIEGYLIADNQHSKQAKDDEYILAELLQEQKNAEVDFESLGFYDEALDDLLAKITPPTLDELAEKYGDDPKEETFWPVIKVKVPPDLKERFDGVASVKKGDDIQKMEHIVSLAEKAQTSEQPSQGTSRILLFVSQETVRRYQTLLSRFEGNNEAERFEQMLSLVEESL